jgi:hypothetical protein
MFKCYIINLDGTNYAAVHARTKAEALKLLGTTRYQFDGYGHTNFEDLPTYGEVYYRPITIHGPDLSRYPWRKTRYHLRHDEQKRPIYE